MVCNLFTNDLNSHARETEGNACNAGRRVPPGVTDILTIGANPTPVIYLASLFRRYGWAVRPTKSLESAAAFLREHKAAVAICEEALPDGAWQDAARILHSSPCPPKLVVIGSDRSLLNEVVASGGFDVLTPPLREPEVIWTIASAWHQWMKRFQDEETGGGRCSDA